MVNNDIYLVLVHLSFFRTNIDLNLSNDRGGGFKLQILNYERFFQIGVFLFINLKLKIVSAISSPNQ